MRPILASFGGLVAGATLGGLVVGAAEGMFRNAGALYAALLYGTLWAIAAALLATLLALALRRPVQKLQLRWGLILALAPSGLVLVRFVVLRDVLHESPHAQPVAAAAGLAVAAAVVAMVLKGAHVLVRRFATEEVRGARLYLLPALVVAAFALFAQAPDDEVTEVLPVAEAHRGRGVILVVIDALRADALGVYGAPPHRGADASPNIDALARRALVFTNTSAQASWTKPAVATIMTSRHASGHNTMSKPAVLPSSLPTIASLLAENGAKTAAVVTNYNLEAGYGFDRGFSRFDYLAPARYLGAPERANRLAAYNVYRLLRERSLRDARQPRYFYRSARAVNARALDILDQLGDGDFFLYLHYMEPHDPYFDRDGASFAKVSDPSPPAAWAPRMHAAYRDEVQRADAALGELVQALDRRGLQDQVTLIVTADHGEEFAEHGGFYHGTTLYEEQLDIPLVIAGPGVTPGTDAALARGLDLAPTILGRFGHRAPPSWEGRDLLTASVPPEATLAEEDHEGNRLTAVRTHRKKLILANPDNPRGLKPTELYDLENDPREAKPIADDPSAVKALGALADQLRAASKQGGASAQERRLDAAAEAELRALGYVH
ncbi:MAG: sulfatase [Deltaproteobacteria bacterium]|nr:sulfatase [Deltaproteobacteria bacterium]